MSIPPDPENVGIWEQLKGLDTAAGNWIADRQQRMVEASKIDGRPSIASSGPVGIGSPLSNPELAPPTPTGPTEVPAHPGIPGSSDSGADEAAGVEAAMLARQTAFPRMQFNIGTGQAVMPEGENYLPWMGAEGKSHWQDTFVDKPKQLEEAIMAGAQAEEDLGKTKADFFKRQQESQAQELAIMKERQLQRQAEVQAKQQQVEQAVTRYSNDLADRGQYWRNPGNIISAIGAALITAGSPGDPGIGSRIINNAVQNDYTQRKELANMHLGELRSNVAKYREIAGDKDLGDRMAYADSQRVAAMEMERIGAQFQGPIAKAKAAVLSKELLRNYQIQMGQIHAQMVYNKAHLENPLVKKTMEATGKATGGVGFTPFGANVSNAPGAPPKAAQGPALGSGPPTQFTGPGGMPLTGMQQDQIVKMLAPPMDEKTRSLYEKRAPGSSRQLESERSEIIRRIWSTSGGDMKTFNKHMEEFQRWTESDIKEIAKAAQPALDKMNGYKRLQQDIGSMEILADRMHVDTDTLIGSGPDSIFGKSFMNKYNDTMDALMRDDPKKAEAHKKERQEVADAVARFRQLLAGHTNAYIKDTSGGAVSLTEDDRLKDYLGLGWRKIRTFYEDRSSRANAEFRGATNTAAHPVSGTLYRIQYGMGTPLLDVKGIEPYSGTGQMQDAVDAKKSKESNMKKAVKTLKGG